METYDLVIIGGSAAAATAGIYAARRNLNFKIITKEFGGEVATSGEIGNWPGVPKTDGLKLAEEFRAHLKSYGVEPVEGVWVEKIHKRDDGIFEIWSREAGMQKGGEDGEGAEAGGNNGVAISALGKEVSGNKVTNLNSDIANQKLNQSWQSDYQKTVDGGTDFNKGAISALGRSVIVATGVHPRELAVPGEKEHRNKGVSYCTVCDGPLFGGKTVAVIGGGNSALESVLMMADIASKVYVLNKNPQFKGDQILLDNLKTKTNVEIIYYAKTSVVVGSSPAGGFVNGLKYVDNEGVEQAVAVDGIFIHIGMVPNSWLVPVETAKDPVGQIVVNKNCETNIPGLYAAGDVTDLPHNQIVIAAGMGATALLSAVNYLNRQKRFVLGGIIR